MDAFVGLVLLAAGLPTLFATAAVLRIAQGRAEHIVFSVVLLLSLAAVVGGGTLIA